MSMKAVVVQEYGDSSKLSYEDVPIPEPGPGEVRKNNQSSSCVVFKVTPFKLFFCRFPPSKKKKKRNHMTSDFTYQKLLVTQVMNRANDLACSLL